METHVKTPILDYEGPQYKAAIRFFAKTVIF